MREGLMKPSLCSRYPPPLVSDVHSLLLFLTRKVWELVLSNLDAGFAWPAKGPQFFGGNRNLYDIIRLFIQSNSYSNKDPKFSSVS